MKKSDMLPELFSSNRLSGTGTVSGSNAVLSSMASSSYTSCSMIPTGTQRQTMPLVLNFKSWDDHECSLYLGRHAWQTINVFFLAFNEWKSTYQPYYTRVSMDSWEALVEVVPLWMKYFVHYTIGKMWGCFIKSLCHGNFNFCSKCVIFAMTKSVQKS